MDTYISQGNLVTLKKLLNNEYFKEETKKSYWEDVYIKHLPNLPIMKAHRYNYGEILEFDSLDELRLFDTSYIEDTRSKVLKHIASKLNCSEKSLYGFRNRSHLDNELIFSFMKYGEEYLYNECEDNISKI